MTKAQLIDELTRTTGESKADCDRNLEAVLTAITQALEKGERLDYAVSARFACGKPKSGWAGIHVLVKQ